MKTPVFKSKKKKSFRWHDREWSDEFVELEQKENPRVLRYLKTENKFAEAFFKARKKSIQGLYKALLSYTAEDDVSVPVREGSFFYWTEVKKGLQYPLFFRSTHSDLRKPHLYMDCNAMAKGHAYYELGDLEVSRDGSQIAFTQDTKGFREYSLFVRSLKTHQDSDCLAKCVSSVAWGPNDDEIFFVVDDQAKRPYRAYRLFLQSGEKPQLVFEEKDERFRLSVQASADRKNVYFYSQSHTSSELRFWDLAQSRLKLFLPRRKNVEYQAELQGDRWIVWTNDCGPEARLGFLKGLSDFRWSRLKTLIRGTKHRVLESFHLFESFCVLSCRDRGLPKILSLDPLKFRVQHECPAFDESYSLALGANPEFSTRQLLLRYSSPCCPLQLLSWDPLKNTLRVLKRTQVPAQPKRSRFHLKRIWIKARDGVRVPVTLFYKKNGRSARPLYLYGYGSYGLPLDPGFSSSRIVLADRGFVVAWAHVRGGGELGKAWHNAGKLKDKQSTFSDFIDAALSLKDLELVDSKKIVIEGGSAGGLLMGAVVNQAPNLWAGVINQVGFVDVVHTMLNPKLPLTVGEYEEWGNPQRHREFNWIWNYAPYQQLTSSVLPRMLVKTSLHDSQVMYWEPAKYVAKIRKLHAGAPQVLFQCLMTAGHGGASGRYDALRDRATELSFVEDCVDAAI